MARQLSMGQINSILTLHQAGRSNRQIANLLGIHRGTVAKHLAAADVPAKRSLGQQNRLKLTVVTIIASS